MSADTAGAACALRGESTLMGRLNGVWHRPALQLFTAIVLAHWAEHLAQAFQLWVLGWPLPQARGVLGLWFPWFVKSEFLHYFYAVVMLVGIWVLRPGFGGLSHRWWTLSLVIQFWHHIEHGLLQGQAIFQHNLFGSPVPVSIVQLWIPRVELHLFYNTAVFIPMVLGMYYHIFPPAGEELSHACGCACRRSPRAAAA